MIKNTVTIFAAFIIAGTLSAQVTPLRRKRRYREGIYPAAFTRCRNKL